MISTEQLSNSISLEWEPPSEPNGFIESYSVTYTGPEMFGGEDMTETVDGIDGTMTVLPDLAPFSNYTVIVHAFTNRGRGDPSDELVVTTEEDSKL